MRQLSLCLVYSAVVVGVALAPGHRMAVAVQLGQVGAARIDYDAEEQQRAAQPPVAPSSRQRQQSKPWDYERACQQPESREEADLCQQWRMAKATEELVTLTDRQFWATVFEIFFLIAAVGAAVWAVIISRQAITADQRAWLTVDLSATGPIIWGTDGSSGTFYAAAKIKNIGKTPALNIHTAMEVICDCRDARAAIAQLSKKQLFRDEKFSRMLVPNDGYDRKFGFGLEPDYVNAGETCWPCVIGCTTYETQYDRRLHQTTFAYMILESDAAGNSIGGIRTDGSGSPHLVAFVCSGGFAN